MNLPSSTATPTSVASDDAAPNSPEICGECGSRAWVIHAARIRGILRFCCTHCILRKHPGSFCPTCVVFYDSSHPDTSQPHTSRRVTCSECASCTHILCAVDANPSTYLCPPCRDPDSFSFFQPILGTNGSRSIDESLSKVFLCAAKISAFSLNKAVSSQRIDAERKGKEAVLARKRAREALEDVVKLDEKEKAKPVIPKLKETSVELFANRDQKPKPASNGAVKEKESSATTTTTTTNSGQLKKQSPAVAKVKQERDTSK